MSYQSQPRKKNAIITMGSGSPNSHAANPYLIFPARRLVLFNMDGSQ
jgi:hypothetical protein